MERQGSGSTDRATRAAGRAKAALGQRARVRTSGGGAALLLALLAGGCVSTQPRLYYNYGDSSAGSYVDGLADEVRLLSCLARSQSRAPGTPGACGGTPVGPRACLGGSGPTSCTEQFLQAGMTLTDLLCQDYFNVGLTRHKHRDYARAVVNDTNGLVTAIMGLTGAGSMATGIVSSSFSYANSTTLNFERNYLVSLDIASTQSLVQRAMAAAAKQNTDKPPKTYYAAERALTRYASLCTFTGMQALLNESARKADLKVDATGTEPVVTIGDP